jgi:hypothetical protein
MANFQDNTEVSAAALSWGELTNSQQQLSSDEFHFFPRLPFMFYELKMQTEKVD